MALDTNWITAFEKSDTPYRDFYKKPLGTVRLFTLYVNKKNHLFHIKKTTVQLVAGRLSRDRLVKILKRDMFHNQMKYRPISLLKYNISLGPEEVLLYLKKDKDLDFLRVEKKIDDIVFEDSVALFHNINSLYLVFHESWRSWHNKTKKIRIKYGRISRGRTKSKRLKTM